MPVIVTKTLSHYDLLEELGHGGMGVVYRAFDRRLERHVAIKVLPPAVADDPAARRRFLREARAIATIHHPNICIVHEIDEVDGRLFIVMEFVRGRTLKEELARAAFEPRRVLDVARQIAAGLDRAHRNGVIHSDIKPSNIMIAADDTVKVLDFGLVRFIQHALAGDATTTLQGTSGRMEGTGIAGTVAYMSPEQVRRELLDARTDIFSLGITLYEVSGQQHPFARASDLETFASVLTEDPPPLGARMPGFPQALESVIFKCLRKSREERYESARALLADLETVDFWRAQSRPAGGRRASVAVLPFTSVGHPPAEEFFMDGVTNEIVSQLARLKNLLVTSRTSTMKYQGSRQDVREIGRELGVSTILEGTVARRQNRCRVTARLISVHDGFHLWADEYDVALGDFFRAQDRVARRIVRALSVQLTAEETEASTEVPPANIAAYQAYLQGKRFYYRFNNADNLIAIEAFRRAIGLDSRFARAHAALAMALVARVERGWESARATWVDGALASSSAAIALNPNLSEPYSARALIEFFGKDLEGSEADVRRALALNPNDDIAHNLLGRVHLQRGELLQAVHAFRQALRISPDYVWCLNDLCWTDWLLGRYRQVDRLLARVSHISPLDESAHVGMAVQAYLRGETRVAIRETERALESNFYNPLTLSVAVHFAFLGRLEMARAWLQKGFAEGLRSRVVLRFNPFLRGFAEEFIDTGSPKGSTRWRNSPSRRTRISPS